MANLPTETRQTALEMLLVMLSRALMFLTLKTKSFDGRLAMPTSSDWLTSAPTPMANMVMPWFLAVVASGMVKSSSTVDTPSVTTIPIFGALVRSPLLALRSKLDHTEL